MPPKPSANADSKTEKKVGSLVCGIRSPGPKYQLKTLVGYRQHCLSKYRNPAYSFGGRQSSILPREGPGPKYLLRPPKRIGFTFGLLTKIYDTSCGPGPKYQLPKPKGLCFTIKSRTNPRKGPVSPGPRYNARLPIPGPVFSMGIRLKPKRIDPVPGPYNVKEIKCKTRMFSFGLALPAREICRSPGPKYNPIVPKAPPKYSFGTRHGECAPPYITECDDIC